MQCLCLCLCTFSMSVNLSLCNISRACVTCELANKESDGLKSNCSRPCGSVKSTWVEGPQEFPCREDTISYKVELLPDGNILIFYADLPRETFNLSLIVILYFHFMSECFHFFGSHCSLEQFIILLAFRLT